MNPRRPLALSAVAVSAAVITSLVLAQGDSKPAGDKQKPLAPQFDAAGGQRWMDACQTDHHHAKLADWIGKWDTETRMWMMGPGSTPSVSKGSAEFSWLFENRWLQQKVEGELDTGMMKLQVKGHGTLGFDRYKQKYVSSYCDSLTTTLLHSEGNFDRHDTSLVMFGFMDEPMSGEHDKCVKYVWKLVSKDRMVFEIHDLPIAEEATKVVEITYTRRKN